MDNNKLDQILERIDLIEKRLSNIEAVFELTYGIGVHGDYSDDLMPEVLKYVSQYEQIKVSDIQAHFHVGFSRAARFIDTLRELSLISPIEGNNIDFKVETEKFIKLKKNTPDGAIRDPIFLQTIELVKFLEVVSASWLQRKLKIGYARACRLLDEMEQDGYIGPAIGSKPRIVLKK